MPEPGGMSSLIFFKAKQLKKLFKFLFIFFFVRVKINVAHRSQKTSDSLKKVIDSF